MQGGTCPTCVGSGTERWSLYRGMDPAAASTHGAVSVEHNPSALGFAQSTVLPAAAQPVSAGESCISCGCTCASTSLPGRLWSSFPALPGRSHACAGPMVAEPRGDELGEECVAGRGPAGSGGSVPELLPAKVCAARRLPGHCCSSPPLRLSAAETGAFCTSWVLSRSSAAALRLGCSGCTRDAADRRHRSARHTRRQTALPCLDLPEHRSPVPA